MLRTVLHSGLVKLLILKIAGAFFAVFIYGKMTSLGDSDYYVAQEIPFTWNIFSDRFLFTQFVFGHFDSVLEGTLVGALVFAMVLWLCIRGVYPHLEKWIFWLVIALPTFVVYSGLPSKEALAIVFFLPVVSENVKGLFTGKMNLPLIFIFLSLGLIVRPHYGMGYLFMTLVTLGLHQRKEIQKVPLVLFSGIALAGVMVIGLGWFDFIERGIWEILSPFQQIFTISQAGRPELEWTSSRDIFRHLIWGVPFGIIGPLPEEIMERPVFILPFLEGLISLGLIFYLGTRVYQTVKSNDQLSSHFWVVFVGGGLMLLIIHYPFGLFNPGAAFRFKQSLVPFLYFYPLLMLGWHKKSEYS